MSRLFGGWFLLALLAAPPDALAQEVVARISALQGSATVARAADRLSAEEGLAIQRRDELITARDGRLRVNFRDGTVVAVGPNSRVLVRHYIDSLSVRDSRGPLLELVVGILRATVPSVGSLGWSVQTRAAVASSRSTDWIIQHREARTSVVVLGGEVEVADPAGGKLLLTGGEGVDVRRNEPVPAEPARWGAVRVIKFIERTSMK